MRRKLIPYISIIYLLVFALESSAQQDTTLRREVEVVKAYDPIISDANKISSMPKIEDTEHKKPSFSYSIFSQPVFNTFSVNTLKAASFTADTREEQGYGMFSAGVGNYNKPYGELFFNSRNIRNSIFGIHGKHLSSLGKITLDGGNRVNAPFSDNIAEMFIKHFFNTSVLTVSLDFSHNGFKYYGYPSDSIPSVLLDDDQDINYLGSGQAFSRGGIKIDLENTSADKDDFVFDFDFLYHYFGNKTSQREHFGKLSANIRKPFDKVTGLLSAEAMVYNVDNIYNTTTLTESTRQQFWLSAQPSFIIGGEIANIEVGLKSWFVLDNNADARARIAPVIKASLVPVKEIINIYAGIGGNYISNYYSAIAYENPFVDPMHDVKNTFEKLHFFGGFDGKFSGNTNFKISADYSLIKNKYFYYLFKYNYRQAADLTFVQVIDNDFDILYDDCDLLKFNAEVFHNSFNKLNFLLSGNYYIYNMKNQELAWNLPEWDAKLSVGYKISEQLDISADIFLTGQRKALVLSFPGEDPRPLPYDELLALEDLQQISYNLPTVIDLNFNAGYKITEQFRIFARLNNFAFQKYQRWLGYNVQSFNFLGGLSYSF